jgi:hypothetical protein
LHQGVLNELLAVRRWRTIVKMKMHELLKAAIHLYFGAAINFVGFQLLVRRAADKVRQTAEKVWPQQKSRIF